tara:strand:+ start:75 stop:476 length:402 start_codon:yes stop_codon:yes gene_type:complete
MNSPLKIIENNFDLPREILDTIQLYLKNDTVNNALISYFEHLYMKKEKYEAFIYYNYIYPKCYCNNCPYNGKNKIYKKKDCNPCFIFESTFTYMPNDFNECIIHNPQFQKIYYNEKKSSEYNDEYEEYYQYDY